MPVKHINTGSIHFYSHPLILRLANSFRTWPDTSDTSYLGRVHVSELKSFLGLANAMLRNDNNSTKDIRPFFNNSKIA